MAALTSALDHMQLGENGSLEFGWSNNVQELLTQFQFQLVRTTASIDNLKRSYENLFVKIFIEPIKEGGVVNMEYVKIFYKLIGHTRDIVSGKGEYNLAYMLVSELYKFGDKYKNYVDKEKIQDMACKALIGFVKLDEMHPYGSWKDLKYFSNYYVGDKSCSRYMPELKNDKLISTVIRLICDQLKEDTNSTNKSLVAKWIPREKSRKFGWLTSFIAREYYSSWFTDGMTDGQYKSASRKALTHFRQLISKINNDLNTPQIKQCNGTWKDINFDKHVSSITMRKQSKAFNLTDKNGRTRANMMHNSDRLQCKSNYESYLAQCREGKKTVKGARISVADFVKDAIELNNPYFNVDNKTEAEMLNMQWNENSKLNSELSNMIVMVDTSGSMECDNCLPLYSAIGLGIRVAEKSKLGKRVITFNAKPEWVNLEGLDFTQMVGKIKEAGWGMNTNFDAAFDMILQTAVANNISPYEMQNFILLICSDMQIDQATKNNSNVMYDRMRNKYAEAGLSSKYKTPYTLPHIVFWNLRSTNGFPSLSTTENTSMLSGNSAALLNNFADKGPSILKDFTPWKMLQTQLSNVRYNYMENVVNNIWSNKIEYMLD